MRVLDISNHDYSTFAPQCFKSAGVERVIVGCWLRDVTEDMVRRCRDVGIFAEDPYAFLYYGLPHERREVENALDVAREIGGIKRIWLDCEADPPHELAGISPGQRVARTMTASTMVQAAGIEPGIYTYGPYWRSKMANSPAFSGLKLWFANYGMNNPSAPIPPVQAVNFGGWSAVAAHQYSSTIPVCGRGRDHNYWYLEEDDDMAENDRQRLDALERALTGLAGDAAELRLSQWNQKGAEWSGNSLLDGYIAEQQKLASHTENHPGGAEVGPHTHVPGEVAP